MDKIKYDLYTFNNKRGGLYPAILPATRKSKIITDITALKSLSEELTGVKESGFISLHKIHDVLSDITEEDIGVLKNEVNKYIVEYDGISLEDKERLTKLSNVEYYVNEIQKRINSL